MTWYVRIRRGHRNTFYRLDLPADTEPREVLQSAYSQGRTVTPHEYRGIVGLTTARTYIGPHCVTRMPEEPKAKQEAAPEPVQLPLLGAS